MAPRVTPPCTARRWQSLDRIRTTGLLEDELGASGEIRSVVMSAFDRLKSQPKADMLWRERTNCRVSVITGERRCLV